METMDFSNKELSNETFDNDVNLTGATFNSSTIENTRFNSRRMYYSTFENAKLRYVEFSSTSMYKVSFKNSIVHGGLFENCELEYASFVNVDLNGSLFIGSDLAGADFKNAIISGVDFTSCNIVRARNIFSVSPIGSRGDTLFAVKHDTCIMLKTGCFWGTVNQFMRALKETHAGTKYENEYTIAVKLIKVHMQD